MGAITLDKVIFISMMLESLVYGSRPKSSCSVTDKLGSRNIYRYVWLHFVGPHSRKNRSNKNMRLLLPTLALYTLATAVSHLIEFMHRTIHLLRQAFDHRRISMCEGIHHTPRYTRPYCLSQRFIESKQPPQKFALCSTNSVGWPLFGKKNYDCYSLRCTWYQSADLPVLGRMATQYMDNNTTNPALDILCW